MTDKSHIKAEDFMESVRTYRVVWDRACADFKIRERKDNAWKAIGTEFSIPAAVAEKHYEYLRSEFGRYLKTHTPPSGHGRDSIDLAGSKYENWRWLMPFISHRAAASSNIKGKKKSISQPTQEATPSERDSPPVSPSPSDVELEDTEQSSAANEAVRPESACSSSSSSSK